MAMRLLTGCAAALLWAAAGAAPSGATQPGGADPEPATADYIHWLEQRSMLYQAAQLATHYSGNAIQWQHPYGTPQPRAAVSRASFWSPPSPASTTPASPGSSVLATLADERLWRCFQAIGIQGIHTGPMKRSGGVQDLAYTPSVDGNFDRISFEIDPAFGTEE